MRSAAPASCEADYITYILYRGLRTAGGMCTFTLGSVDLVNARYPAASSRNAAALAKCGVTELPPTRELRQLMDSHAEDASSRYLADDGTHAHGAYEDEQGFDDLYTFYDVPYHDSRHEVVNGAE